MSKPEMSKPGPAIELGFKPHWPSKHSILRIFWTEDGENFQMTPAAYITDKFCNTEHDMFIIIESLLCWIKVHANKPFSKKIYYMTPKLLWTKGLNKWIKVNEDYE